MRLSEKKTDENARMYASRVILDNIINLELPPGSGLSENELSGLLNLSRTPVREALIEMRRMGLVEIIPQKGSFVTKIDYELIEEAKFMRLALENAVLRLGCEQGVSEHILNQLKENLEQQSMYTLSEEAYSTVIGLDNSFHRLLFEAVDKIRTYELLQTQMVHFDRLRTLAYKALKGEKNSVTLKDHENILYALIRRDYELGEMVMARHLTRHQVEKKELDSLYPEYFL